MAIGGNRQQQQTPTAAKQLVVRSSKEMPFWSAFRMGIIAPAAEGKTHTILTASAKLETGVLDDIVLVETDGLGLATAYERGLEVPRIIDLTDFTDEDMARVFDKIPDFVAEEVARAPCRCVGIDTASVLFAALIIQLQQADDSAKVWATFAKRLRTFYSKLRKVPVPVVFTFHVKAPKIVLDKSSSYIADTASAAGLKQGALTMDLQGQQAANAIRAAHSQTGRLRKTMLGGGKTKWELEFDPVKDEAKRRFTRCLDAVEPADLSHIFNKIAEGCNQPLPGSEV